MFLQKTKSRLIAKLYCLIQIVFSEDLNPAACVSVLTHTSAFVLVYHGEFTEIVVIFSSLLLMSPFPLIPKIFYLLRLTYLAQPVSSFNCFFFCFKNYLVLRYNFLSPWAVRAVEYFAVFVTNVVFRFSCCL